MSNRRTVRAFKKAVTTAGTPVQLDTTVNSFPQVVVIRAESGNTGNIYVGCILKDGTQTALAASGYPLAAGASISLSDIFDAKNREGWDLSQIYLDADTSGNAVKVLCDYIKNVAD